MGLYKTCARDGVRSDNESSNTYTRTNVGLQPSAPLRVQARDGGERPAGDVQVAAHHAVNAAGGGLVVEKLHVEEEDAYHVDRPSNHKDVTAHVNLEEVGVAQGPEANERACLGMRRVAW